MDFNKYTYICSNKKEIGYLLSENNANILKNEMLPLIVYLHGTDGCGDDPDSILHIQSLPSYSAENKLIYEDKILILAPQCPMGKHWRDIADEVGELIKEVARKNCVDVRRISLTGASLGGMGTFELGIRFPEIFSCLVPVCGSVDPEACSVLKQQPVWIFHGELDTGMGFSVIEANEVINKAGGQSRIELLKGEGHEIRWIYYANKYDVINWMIRQRKV